MPVGGAPRLCCCCGAFGRVFNSVVTCGASVALLDIIGLQQKFAWMNIDGLAGASIGLQNEGLTLSTSSSTILRPILIQGGLMLTVC